MMQIARHVLHVVFCLALVCFAGSGCRGGSPTDTRNDDLEEAIRRVRAGTTTTIDLNADVRDAELAGLSDLDQLEELVLPAARVGDEGLRHLSGLTRLVRLDIGGDRVTDRGLACLHELKGLRYLNLHNTRLSDAGLQHLKEFPRLEQLRVGGPGITDQGVQVLATLPALCFVHLLDVRLTDEGLKHFHGMKQLESLYLDRVQVTDDGIARLLESLPHLHIHLDETHPPGMGHDAEH